MIKTHTPRRPTYLYLQIPEFWAGYQWTLRVAVESQRKKRAIGTRSPENCCPECFRFSHLHIPFAAEVSLDAVSSLSQVKIDSGVGDRRPTGRPANVSY